MALFNACVCSVGCGGIWDWDVGRRSSGVDASCGVWCMVGQYSELPAVITVIAYEILLLL